MRVLPVHPEILEYLRRRKLETKFAKQIKLFERNAFHPSLETELLKPPKMRIWSFRVDRKYRAIFIFREKNLVEIIEISQKSHPFYLGIQGHPEYKSRPMKPHPIFIEFLKACSKNKSNYLL